jgi:hypothetical protein
MANNQDNNHSVSIFLQMDESSKTNVLIFFLYVVTSSVGSRTHREKNRVFLKLAETCFILISNSFECT